MRAMQAAALVLLVLAASAAEAGEVRPAVREEIDQVRRAVDEGRYGEAAKAARPLASGIKDPAARTEVMELLAVALRKDGQWKAAAGAYRELAARWPEGEDERILYEGTAEALEASAEGFYPGVGLPKPDADPDTPRKTLAHDATLAEALARLGQKRADRVKRRSAALARARTPAAVVEQVEEVAEGYRQARVLAPKLSRDLEVQAARTAARRMETLYQTALPKLRAKMDELHDRISVRGTVSNTTKTEAETYSRTCQEMADSEGAFRRAFSRMAEDPVLNRESWGRQRRYELLAVGFKRLARSRVGRDVRRRPRRGRM